MRILLVSHRFPPNFLGGADLYAYGIADALRERGHVVAVLCAEDLHADDLPAGTVALDYTPYDGLAVRRLRFNWQSMPDPYGWLYISNPLIEQITATYIAEFQPDVMHVTASDYVTVAPIVAARRAGMPVVLTLTGKWHICPVATLLRWDGEICAGRQDGMTCLRCMFGETRTQRALAALPDEVRSRALAVSASLPRLSRHVGSLNFIHAVDRRNEEFVDVLNGIDYIVSPSQCHQDVFAATGILPSEAIHLSRHGFNGTSASEGRVKTPSERLRIGYTGQLLPHKGVHVLVEALRQFADDGRIELYVYGDANLDPDYSATLMELAAGQPSIHFRGRFENGTVGRVLSQIDVVAVPSTCVENSPLTILEAFAAGTPVVGSDTCGVNEMLEGDRGGLLFRRGDADDLARELRRLLDEPALMEYLRERVPPVRGVMDEAAHLEVVYAQVLGDHLKRLPR